MTDKVSPSKETLSDALKMITNGFYIVASKKPGKELKTQDDAFIAAATVSWLTQVSSKPKKVAIAVKKNTDLSETIQKTQIFSVNVVGKADIAMIEAFAKDSHIKGNRINEYTFEDGKATGSSYFRARTCLDGVQAGRCHHP